MTELLSLSATEAKRALTQKEISAVELTTAYLEAIDQTAGLNNYVAVTADKALEMAANSDKKIAGGTAGTLEGLPVGVKDLFCTQMKYIQDSRTSKHMAPNMQRGLAN